MDDISEAVEQMDVIQSGRLRNIDDSDEGGSKSKQRVLYTYVLRNYGILHCDGLGTDYRIRGSAVRADKNTHTLHITPSDDASPFSLGARDDAEFEAWAEALTKVSIGQRDHSYIVDNTQLIAKGSSCSIFAGQRERDGLDVVVKAISRRGKTKTPALVETTVGKMLKAAASKPEYPHGLVRVFEVYHTANEAHIVMEKVRGRSLEEWLQEHGTMSDALARDVFLQIFKAVSFLHRNRILHGAVTPSNVLFVENGRMDIKLIGFNAASWKDGNADFLPPRPLREYQRCLTKDGLEFIAPEIWRGQAAGMEADFWALGCTLYKMLLGHLPFAVTNRKPWRGDGGGETMQKYAAIRREDLMQEVLFPSSYEKAKSMSSNARIMLFQLLRPNPRQRMSHANAQRHPWLTARRYPLGGGSGRTLSPADFFD